MANSQDMHKVIMQAAILAAILVVRALKEADLTAEPHTRRSSPEELHRPRQAGPILSQGAFDWKVPGRYETTIKF